MIRGVQIKKLEWEEDGWRWLSETPFGTYDIWRLPSEDNREIFCGYDVGGLELLRSGDIGKVMGALQTHFDKQVLALITFVVEPSVAERELIETIALRGDGREDDFGGFYDTITRSVQ